MEQGVAMLFRRRVEKRAGDSSEHRDHARLFVRLRATPQTNEALSRKLAGLERKYDGQFRVVFDAIRDLMTPPATPRTRIGFRAR